MRVKNVASRTENPENEVASADLLEMEKQVLRREILELQTLISKVEEQNIDSTKFGVLASSGATLPTAREIQTPTRLPDLDAVFRHEIYTYLGLYCVKSTRNEYVFNFAADETGDETFSVQIRNGDGKVSLGNWVMPMSVDMKKIHHNTPIDSLAMVIPFLKNCKQQVDCYRERKCQFESLKDYVSDTSNCEIDANLGFTLIKLRLLGVYSKPRDLYVDLTIDLSYKSNETRPCAMAVDWSLRKDPSELQENEMKSYAKFLRNQSLLNGFKHMIESIHAVYNWVMEEYVNSPLELSNSSGSEAEGEGSLLIAAKRKRNRLTVRRRKDRDLKDRWRKRQRLSNVVTRSPERKSSTDAENENPTTEKHSPGETRNRSAVRSPDRPRSPDEPNESPPTLRSPKSVAKKNTESKKGRKLRQTTIDFTGGKSRASIGKKSANSVAGKSTEVDETKPRSRDSKARAAKIDHVGKTEKKSKSKAPTWVVAEKSVLPRSKPVGILSRVKSGSTNVKRASSTPLHKQVRGKVKFATIGDMAISPIASADEN